ncbi:ABC transporter substrate-binding protein [Carboxylicivirga sp. M1479]|uniref:ABC transporter substrate-binding protein n=1 Tax=Carboxylicivirga sp. M1479 TaxID=2594476 RepID=UPI0011776806|nr:ABC transporter substrate-binding protein [Carboxylicivirga sp. M1479]TRX66334.1 hypothetical protein FNN09_14095 [Carboxylicivirga sp. M1479]
MKQALKLVSCLLILLVCHNSFAKQVNDTIVLQLKWKHQFQFAGFYAAIKKGYYADQGFHVIVKPGHPGVNMVQEVLSGNAHYGISNSALISDRNNKLPVVALAAIFQHSPEVLIARKDTSIKTIGDFKNSRISIGRHGLTSTEALLMKFGISNENYTYNNSTSLIDDLANQQTDIIASYLTDAPNILDQKGIEHIVFKPRSYGIDLYGDILFTSQANIEQNRRKVERFVKASLNGWIYAMDNKEELIEHIINTYETSLSEEQLRYEATVMEELIMPKLIDPGHMSPERWHYIAETFVRIGQLQPLYSIDGFLLEDYQPFNTRRIKLLLYILLAIVILSLISLSIFFTFNRRLKKSVLERTEALSQANKSLRNEISRRQMAHANLSLSEDRYKLLFEDSPISLWEEDFSQTKQMLDELVNSGNTDIERYLRSNPNFVKECAQGVRIININKATVQYMEAKDKKYILENVNQVFNEMALKDFAEELITFYKGIYLYEQESEHITFKGNKIHVSITVKIPNGYEKTWSKVIVSLINVTDLKKTTEELSFKEILLRQQNEALKGINEELKNSKIKAEESDRLKTAFLSNMSHEIRTPMNGIVGFTDLLKDSSIRQKEREHYLDIIEDNSQQLLRIISDIIDISKIEASQLKVVKSDINIEKLFKHLHEVFQLRINKLEKQDLELSYYFHPDLDIENLRLESDITRLRQILTNLLENAVKFTPKGSIEFGIVPSNQNDMLILYVKDTGIGIKTERVSQIFDRFFREEERFGANLGGTGLGLSIAKNLVELLGGQIFVQSKPAEGTKFYFTHPYKQ